MNSFPSDCIAIDTNVFGQIGNRKKGHILCLLDKLQERRYRSIGG